MRNASENLYVMTVFQPVMRWETIAVDKGCVTAAPQAGLVWWDTVSPFKPFGPVLALTFVLVVGALKALAEDRRRHVEDNYLNNSVTHVLHPDGAPPWLSAAAAAAAAFSLPRA